MMNNIYDVYDDSEELVEALEILANKTRNTSTRYTLKECSIHIEGMYVDFRKLLAYYKWNERKKNR